MAAGTTAVPSLGCSGQDMLGIKSSGSSGGSAATLSMELSDPTLGFLASLKRRRRREREGRESIARHAQRSPSYAHNTRAPRQSTCACADDQREQDSAG